MLDNVARAAASAAILDYKAHQLDAPHVKEAPLPPLIKWLVGAVSAFGTAALIGLGIWLVSSVSTMRETLARMDERMANAGSAQVDRFNEIERRITKLEGYHAGGGK